MPKDGVRKCFHAMLDGGTLHSDLEADRFAAARPITLAEDLSEVSFQVESENAAAHTAVLRVSGLAVGRCAVHDDADGESVATLGIEDGREAVVGLPTGDGAEPKAFGIFGVPGVRAN